MPKNTVLIVIAVLVGSGVIAAIAYYVFRFMKGTIKLSLPRTAFNPGDTIIGSFNLHTKKSIQGNKLIVSLIGTQVTRTHHNGKTQMHSREIYRDEVLVEDSKTYDAESKAKYNFEIAVPNMQSPEFLNSTVGQTLTAVVRLLGSRSTHLKWKIEVRLDAKGIDLATAKSVSINTKQLI